MKKVQVLGPGCPKCEEMAKLTREAIDQTGVACEFEKVTDIQEIMKAGVMFTPALVVDGEVKISGKVPKIDDLKKMLM